MYIKVSISKSMSGSTSEIKTEIEMYDRQLNAMMGCKESYGSQGQFDVLLEMKGAEEKNLEASYQELKDFETKLQQAQNDIEQKENEQQDLKLSHMDHEEKLQELMASFSDVSQKSEDLEKRIAQSMDNIESMQTELQLNEAQTELFQKLSDALTTAGGLMRDLISEQMGVEERLNMLEGQHEDLEDEYTRLVEQQLGE